MEFKKCECGRILPLSGWRFCEMCGQYVSDEDITSSFRPCSNCGYIYSNSARYCICCGTKNEYLEELKKKVFEKL